MKEKMGAGEMGQWLETPVVLAESQSSNPSTSIKQHITANPEECDSLICLWTSTLTWHAHIYTYIKTKLNYLTIFYYSKKTITLVLEFSGSGSSDMFLTEFLHM